MANYKINVNSLQFRVTQSDIIETECTSSYEYSVIANDGESIDITISGDYINAAYVSKGISTEIIDTATVIYDTSLILKYSIENSGINGTFNEASLEVINDDTTTTKNTYTFNTIRSNDSANCNQDCNGGLYPSELFNPTIGEVNSGSMTRSLLYDTRVAYVSINGLLLDDTEYDFTSDTFTIVITPDNGFDDIDDEVLIFQNKT